MSKRVGLPVTLKMRHDAHYVESLASYSGAAVGRMIPVDQIRPNPEQPRKALGDLRELTESIREKGVLEPLLVRFMPREDCYYIISGERRYHASRAAGLREVPCIEKMADDAETLEIALIENIQRKDLTPFEEADGLQRLAEQFDYTHEDVAKKIGRARSSVSETLSLRLIPDALRKKCIDGGILSKSLLLQIAKQPTEKKMGGVGGEFDYTHEDVAKKIGRARSSVSETLSLRLIPDALRKKCIEGGILSKSLLLQIAKQPTEKKMAEMVAKILAGGLTRDEARKDRTEDRLAGPQKPQPFIFQYEPENEAFRFRLQFKKSHVSRDELIRTLREILAQLEGHEADSTAA